MASQRSPRAMSAENSDDDDDVLFAQLSQSPAAPTEIANTVDENLDAKKEPAEKVKLDSSKSISDEDDIDMDFSMSVLNPDNDTDYKEVSERYILEYQEAVGEETKAKEKFEAFRKKLEEANIKLKNYESTFLESEERTKAAKTKLDELLKEIEENTQTS